MKKIDFQDNKQHLIYKCEHFEVYATGHDWDFKWFIQNLEKHPIALTIDGDDWMLCEIKAEDWCGLLDTPENKAVIDNLVGNKKDSMYDITLRIKNKDWEEYAFHSQSTKQIKGSK